MIDHEGLAAELDRARTTATPVPLLTGRHGDFGWSDARAVAKHTDVLRELAGETQIGWKLGWTSEAMRSALGIDRPNWGTLWNTQLVEGGLRIDDFIHPKVEPELVWRAPVGLTGATSARDIERIGGAWAVGIEVVDPRFPSFDFDALDNTADNSSSAAIRIGDFVSIDDDVSRLTVTFSDGSERRSGPGSQAMGSPWEAIAWLVRSLDDEGLHVRAGDIVFTGGLTAPFDVHCDMTYSVEAGAELAGTTLRFD